MPPRGVLVRVANTGLSSGKSEKSGGKSDEEEGAGSEEVSRSETAESARALYKDAKKVSSVEKRCSQRTLAVDYQKVKRIVSS